ncbi:prepilin-type N-terminal cleavage/methylation domain-containing protein [Patescibacteria group bacterium]|nr:prepilin-type N-terminal cleavage/methylation domain-containing protein [Patescibacteria group bacterium]MBU4512293.1 prepilin-type N-terminal cleavage/methylation domain-containing protein [Patescibacteria group bacterium]MCG2693647.1 prepilin-type N-terminal cleavage/methylation domain-containing protein [Candidatus Parcubacteria bacterium]
MRKNKGFTLIELLVVIAIIGLLSTLAVVALNSARQKSRDAKRVADIKQIQTALELYYNDNNGYPVLAAEAAPPVMAGIMAAVPTAPTPNDGSCTAANNAYLYNSTTNTGTSCGTAPCPSYELQFCLGANTGGLVAGPACATPSGIDDNQACTLTD